MFGLREGAGWGLSALCLALLLPGCRDSTEFGPADPLVGAGEELPRQLTWSPEDDRAPTWSPDGQEVYYDTHGLYPFAETPGLLMRVPVEGATAEPLLPELQFPSAARSWLTSVEVSPDGSRLAYVEMETITDGDLCSGPNQVVCEPATIDHRGPRLRTIRYRVGSVEGGGAEEGDPSLRIRFAGQTELEPSREVQPPGLTRRFEVELYPFHVLFNGERAYIFRPSWAQDGRKLAVSTGLELGIWEIASDTFRTIPGTDDGVHAAWSPDGEWIAYTELERGEPFHTTCRYINPLGTPCQQFRTVYPVAGRRVVLVRPDGSEIRELGEGYHPAWTPDSERLVFRRGDELVVAAIGGGDPMPIPGTEGGIEPKVSPDGHLVAFARTTGSSDADIWVAALPGAP